MAFDQAKADKVCELLAAGSSLRKAAEGVGLSHSTVLEWCDDVPEFGNQYARARSIGYRLLSDEIIEIADEKSGDPVRDRLRVDTRKWMLAKMLPKVYGDRIDHNHSGTVQFQRIESVVIDAGNIIDVTDRAAESLPAPGK